VSLNDDAKRFANFADVGIGVGIVGLVVGTYLVVTGARSKPVPASTAGGVTLPLTVTAAAVGMTLGACQLVGDITDRSLESPGGDDGATLTDSRAPGVDGTVEKDRAPGSRPDANASSDAAIDGGNDATAPECLTNAQCTARASAEATEAGSVAATGDAAFNGILDGGVVPAVCVQSIGKCAPLLTPDCRALYGDYTNDNS